MLPTFSCNTRLPEPPLWETDMSDVDEDTEVMLLSKRNYSCQCQSVPTHHS